MAFAVIDGILDAEGHKLRGFCHTEALRKVEFDREGSAE